ncbi:proline-rich protein 18 [Diceros bicornis minor]|uniref:proline-rich protein 18 n=1 Tax=Diceros bicornis minor TaxID=77932 RepID=UPI0026EC47B0|nr:proline-rich protein 18 [Diceros bicornis minor]
MIRRLGSTMPFPPVPPPPSAPAPGVPAARPPPRRPGAPRKAAAPACAPPGPSPPAAAGEKKKRPPERPEGLLSSSWPSATLKRPPARRAPGPAPPRAPPQAAPGRPRAATTCVPPRPAGSGHSPAGATGSGARTAGSGTAAPGAGPDDAVRFSLSLTPEAVLVIQRRHLEKQLLARPRRPVPSPSADARRLLAPCPRARAAGLSRRPPAPGGLQAPDPGPRPADLRPVLKVSLLNERHRYDDVEYEEESEAVDEGLVRKCTEWLRGVESAAGRAGPVDALPHLSTL